MELFYLIFASLFILFYYSLGKKLIIYFSVIIVKSRLIKSKIVFQELKGIIELFLIVISHVLFVFFLSSFLQISLTKVFKTQTFHFSSLLLGAMLGIGQMALSSTICLLLIRVLGAAVPERVPLTTVEWVVQSRAGWIKHHFDVLKHLPVYVSLSLILIQIAAEETVFRGILLNYLLPYSKSLAIGVSTLFFALIQTFLMPRKISSMFPVVGALIMGFTNAHIYTQVPDIYPLIIGHVVFFLFSLFF